MDINDVMGRTVVCNDNHCPDRSPILTGRDLTVRRVYSTYDLMNEVTVEMVLSDGWLTLRAVWAVWLV